MKHHIRINRKVREINCELGSDRLDDNGREIFEGDIVKFIDDEDEDELGEVSFHHNTFWVNDNLPLDKLLYEYTVTVSD